MGDVVLENTSNPFTQDRLTPEHLALLFPPKFYQNDDSLALHLSGELSLCYSISVL